MEAAGGAAISRGATAPECGRSCRRLFTGCLKVGRASLVKCNNNFHAGVFHRRRNPRRPAKADNDRENIHGTS